MRSKRVFDVAICMGYMMLEKEDPIHTAASIAKGFLSKFQFTEDEVKIMLPASLIRICVSVCLSHFNFQNNPHNEYLLVTAGPGWKLLKYVRDTYGSLAKANERFHQYRLE